MTGSEQAMVRLLIEAHTSMVRSLIEAHVAMARLLIEAHAAAGPSIEQRQRALERLEAGLAAPSLEERRAELCALPERILQ